MPIVTTPLGSAEVDTVDYKGRVYRGFHARRDPLHSSGWVVFGHATGGEYGGHLICRVATLPGLTRARGPFSARRAKGWRTRRDAAAVAAWLTLQYSKVVE